MIKTTEDLEALYAKPGAASLRKVAGQMTEVYAAGSWPAALAC